MKPEPKVIAFVATQALDLLYVSTVTLAEIRFGIELVETPRAAPNSATGLRTKCAPCSSNGFCR